MPLYFYVIERPGRSRACAASTPSSSTRTARGARTSRTSTRCATLRLAEAGAVSEAALAASARAGGARRARAAAARRHARARRGACGGARCSRVLRRRARRRRRGAARRGVGAAARAGSLPPRVLRRVAFLVPSLVLLVFVTTAPHVPRAGQPVRAASASRTPQVEAALRAQYGVPESAARRSSASTCERLLRRRAPRPVAQGAGAHASSELLAPALPVSLTLGLLALMLAVGARARARRARRAQAATRASTTRAWGSRWSASRCRTS